MGTVGTPEPGDSEKGVCVGHLQGCEHPPTTTTIPRIQGSAWTKLPTSDTSALLWRARRAGGRGKKRAAVTEGGRRGGDKFPAQRKNPDQKG